MTNDLAMKIYDELRDAWIQEIQDRDLALQRMIDADLVADITMRCPEDCQPSAREIRECADTMKTWAREELGHSDWMAVDPERWDGLS